MTKQEPERTKSPLELQVCICMRFFIKVWFIPTEHALYPLDSFLDYGCQSKFLIRKAIPEYYWH